MPCTDRVKAGPAQPQGHLPEVPECRVICPVWLEASLVLCPDRVGLVRLATLLAVRHVCQGKVSVYNHIRSRPSQSPSPPISARTQKYLLWHQSSGTAGAANLLYFPDCLAAPEGEKYEFLSLIYQTFIIVC